MSDDKNMKKAAPPLDRRFISLEEKWEVDYWRNALRCSADELREAVAAVGKSSRAVRAHLQMMRSDVSVSG